MADIVDRAQELEQRQRDAALARITASFAPRDPRVDTACADCGGAIEPARLRTLNTIRCRACAHAAAVAWGANRVR